MGRMLHAGVVQKLCYQVCMRWNAVLDVANR